MSDRAPLYFEARLGGLFPASAKAEEACRIHAILLENQRPDGCANTTPSLTKPSDRSARMAKGQLPSPDELRQLLRYEPETGLLFWRSRTPALFTHGRQTAEHNCAIWNGKFANKPALNCPDKFGYLTGCVMHYSTKAHRVIWAMVHGEWPAEDIDHIDGNPANNRLGNLRAVSHAENGRNLKLKSNNTSGACGVSRARSGKWIAKITVNRRSIMLGTFPRFNDAVEARLAAEQDLGFHSNHGKRS